MEKIKKLSEKYFEKVCALRRHFHQYPELSGKEFHTAEKIAETLEELQIKYMKNVAGTGIVAIVTGNLLGSKCVALRADMDALPVEEANNIDYKSVNKGVMHACGHDMHIASLLGILMIINDLKDDFGGTVKAIFQPSEEEYDGGALAMIETGVLENPSVNVIFGQHVTPELKTGTVGVASGAFMASTDEIHITIKGKGGHAALRHEVVNPIMVGVNLLSAIENAIEPFEKIDSSPLLVTFGKFVSQGKTNIVNDTAEIEGTIRTFDEDLRIKIDKIIRNIAHKMKKLMHATIIVDIRHGYPVLINEPETAQRMRQYAQQYLGSENTIDLPKRMTADDFAYFLQKKQGCYYRLGIASPTESITHSLHSDTFNADENALVVGMGLMSYIALNELQAE